MTNLDTWLVVRYVYAPGSTNGKGTWSILYLCSNLKRPQIFSDFVKCSVYGPRLAIDQKQDGAYHRSQAH